MSSSNWVANGNISPARFVRADTSGDHLVVQAGANEQPVGVAQVGANQPPLSDLVSTPYAATAGQPVKVHGLGENCLVEAGGAFDAGVFLKADSSGRAVAIATTGTTLQRYGAKAEQASTGAGQMIRVQVLIGSERPALT